MLRAPHRWFLLPLVEVITVGFPFCGNKLLTGRLLLDRHSLRLLGLVLVALGVIDLLLNSLNFLTLLLGRRDRLVAVCTLEGIARLSRPRDPAFAELGTSLDVLLSFTLVAVVVGTDSVGLLGATGAKLWSLCTVFNVLGAGLGRVARALESVRERSAPSSPDSSQRASS